MSYSFAAKTAPLAARVQEARTAQDAEAERHALDTLLDAYVQLGNRAVGSNDEQNAYIIGRRLGALPEELQALGVTHEDLPMPEVRRGALPTSRPDPSAAIADRFARLGGPEERPPRYYVEDRPQDNMRHLGRLLRYAVIDSTDGLPVGWYTDRDLAETVADTAVRLRTTG
ncbi:hypothetical protein ACIO3O_37125 [Streptomyces sp. NPDC087440]|uniref:hypothetical protein n=1 Tax=Streptomyces sp. NPDC087440 TaxID=3365790 RepID=UPI003808DE66